MVDKTGPLLYYMDMKRIMSIFVILAFIAAARAGAEPFAWAASSNYTDKVLKTVTELSQLKDAALQGKVVKFKNRLGLINPGSSCANGRAYLSTPGGIFLILSPESNNAFSASMNRRSSQSSNQAGYLYIYIPDNKLAEQISLDTKQPGPFGIIIGSTSKVGLKGTIYNW